MFERIKHTELSIGEVISLSWSIFKQNFRLITLMLLLIYIPIAIYIPTGLLDIVMDLAQGVNVDTAMGDFLSFFLLVGIVSTIVMMIVIYLTENTIKGEPVMLGSLLSKSLHRFFPLFVTVLLQGIILAIALLLLVIPAIILGTFFVFVPHAVILRKRIGIGALKYSKYVVTGYWGYIFLTFLLINIVDGGIQRLIEGINSGYAGVIFFALITSFVTMFFYIMKTVLFLNMDYIKESASTLVASLKNTGSEVASVGESQQDSVSNPNSAS